MTTVTLTLLLDERRRGKDLYSPAPGTAYEIAPGIKVRLKAPTLRLQAAFFEATKEMEAFQAGDDPLRETLETSRRVAEVITDGAWPETDELFSNVVQRIIVDFMSASEPISRPATITSDAYGPLIDQVLSRLSGQENGLPEPTDAES